MQSAKPFLLIVFLICANAHTYAQNISGNVVSNNTPLDGATVLLLKAKDSLLVKSAITDAKGIFSFENIKANTYLLKVSYSGKQTFISAPFTYEANTTKVVDVINMPDNANLGNVTVIAQKPFVSRKIDRTIVNPDALISNAGSTALEVLEKAPGVQVNQDGIISLRGNSGVVVFIDDKPTYMAASDLAGYLRGLPSASIDVIEIMTNPPAKYDAAGNFGVINIKMKKLTQKGFNGSLSTSYGQGIYARSNNSFNFNYRINKWNFFSNVGYTYGNVFQDLVINRNYFTPTGNLDFSFNQNSLIRKTPQSFTGKIGADFYASKKLTLGFVYNGFRNRADDNTINYATNKNAANQLLNSVKAFSPAERRVDNNSYNLNLNYKFSTKTEVLVAYDYITYNANQNNSLLNNVYNSNGSLNNSTNLVSKLPSNIEITSAKTDFTTAIKNGKLEYGAKSSWVNTKNVAGFYDEVSSVLNPNWDFSNNFNYKENINAGYINWAWDAGKKISFQAGLRVENTAITGNSFGNPTKTDSSFKRDYTNLFPTFFINYTLDTLGHHVLNLNVGRRINRPNYQDMNPFIYPLDRFTLYAGNPFLQPTFSYNIEVSYIYKNNWSTTLQYSTVTNQIQESIQQQNGIFYSRPGNFGKQISYTLSTNGMVPIKKWWKLQVSAQASYNKFETSIYNQALNNEGTFVVLSPINLFQINKQWSAELRANYQSPIYIAQFVTIPQFLMGAAVAKKIMKDKGSIKLNINDMFYTLRTGGDIKAIENSTANWRSHLDSRVFTLTFTYRFSKGKNLQVRTITGANEEKARVKT